MITVTIFYFDKYLIAYHYRRDKKLHFDHTINKIDDDSVNNEMIFSELLQRDFTFCHTSKVKKMCKFIQILNN